VSEWTRESLAQRTDEQVASIAMRVLNRFAKWRTVFASWQLGSRSDDDGECRALKDHRELSMMLRVEVSALSALLIDKGVFTARELTEQTIIEAEMLDEGYSRAFPGFKSHDSGMDIDLVEARATMSRFGFPS
jgi:hypothetical protein